MKLSRLLVLSPLCLANANYTDSLRRRLSYQKIAGYAPGTQVTDHCAIDQDQWAIERELAKKTDSGFSVAEGIYFDGGNSKSYALITLSNPLQQTFSKGMKMQGKTADGKDVAGKMYETYPQGSQVIKFQYETSDDQDHHVLCKVGALPEDMRVMDGCLAEAGTIYIGNTAVEYQYIPTTQNLNGRTIAGFSTEAAKKMRVDCDGCPYKDHEYFFKYYGVDDYGDQWVLSALNGQKTSFTRGNADFSIYGFDGKVEAAKKGMVFFNIFMYVIREFEDALDDCERGCELDECNDDAVHAWDEGVCFYTGSIEGEAGTTDSGMLLHQLADKRCNNFKTCEEDGADTEGRAKVNYDLFKLFDLGKFQLQTKNCQEARSTVSEITRKMYIPFIQGTLRYAYKLGVLNGDGGEKSAAEGAVFAAAILPRVQAANPDAADIIYNNMKTGADSTDFAKVKRALESVYEDLGITCADVGGLWNVATQSYWKGAEPCGPVEEIDDVDLVITTVASAVGGVIFSCLLAICYVKSQGSVITPGALAAKQPELEASTDAEFS